MQRVESNFNFFRNTVPELADWLDREPAHGFFTEKSRNGKTIIRSGSGAWLHSRYDPVREAARKGKEIRELAGAGKVVVLVGFGAGFIIPELVPPQGRVIVVEPFVECWKAASENIDFESIWGCPGISFVWDIGELRETISSSIDPEQDTTVNRVIHPNEFKEFPDLLERILNDIRLGIEERISFNLAVGSFAGTWLRNGLSNLFRGTEYRYYGDIPNFGGTVVVVGSGPTLTDHLDLVLELSGRVPVFCADSSLKCLIENGVRCTVVGSIDPQEYVREFFEGVEDPGKTVLLFDTLSRPEVTAIFKNKILAPSDHPLNTWCVEKGLIPGLFLGQGGSVVNALVRFALQKGAGQVLLVGTDFGYPGRRLHARGTKERVNELARFRGIERFMVQERKNVYVVNGEGVEIPTSNNLKLYRDQIEKTLEEYPDRTVYQADPRSARIEGSRVGIPPLEKILFKDPMGFVTGGKPLRFDPGRLHRELTRELSVSRRTLADIRSDSFGRILETLVYASESRSLDEAIELLREIVTSSCQ